MWPTTRGPSWPHRGRWWWWWSWKLRGARYWATLPTLGVFFLEKEYQNLVFLVLPSHTFALPGVSGISRFLGKWCEDEICPDSYQKNRISKSRHDFCSLLMLSLGPSALIFRDEYFSSWTKIPESNFDDIQLSRVSGFLEVSRISRFWRKDKNCKSGFK